MSIPNVTDCRYLGITISVKNCDLDSVAYLGFHLGGGVKINLRKVFTMWFRGHVPPKNFLKIVQFGAFWSIFCCNFIKKIFLKMFIFYKENYRHCITANYT